MEKIKAKGLPLSKARLQANRFNDLLSTIENHLNNGRIDQAERAFVQLKQYHHRIASDPIA